MLIDDVIAMDFTHSVTERLRDRFFFCHIFAGSVADQTVRNETNPELLPKSSSSSSVDDMAVEVKAEVKAPGI